MANIFLMPAIVHIGDDALNEAIQNMSGFGNKALIVSDDMMLKLGNIDKLVRKLDEFNIKSTVFANINSEPTIEMVNEGLSEYRNNGCDFLIGFGGGSPIDAMKAIVMSYVSDKPLPEMIGVDFACDRPKLVAIPTTAGTGSEATQFTIITDTRSNIKMLLKGRSLIPDMAVIDPQFSLTLPPKVTAATGIDALCHALEAYTSKKAQPLTDVLALSAIKRIFDNIQTCYEHPNDQQARLMMALAAFEAGCAFNNSSVTLIHGLSRPIGANFHIAHGLSNAVLLRASLNYIKDSINDRLAAIAYYCHLSDEKDELLAANDLLDKIDCLLKSLNVPSLKELVDKEIYLDLLDKMSWDALSSGSPANSRIDLSKQDLINIYLESIK
ncbi:MAG: iron-containing alcohol dehydrogenase [Erysipelotrichaceae bacterium]|nr:iron-containing alcohol dehydrogenase [Erysipelotrichaceae bacterium]